VVGAVEVQVGAGKRVEIVAEKVEGAAIRVHASVVRVDAHGCVVDLDDATVDATLTDLHELRIRQCELARVPTTGLSSS
jgi:hypothetical protein